MELLFSPFLLIPLLLFGPFIALNAYLLVWLCGPAIRRAGRCWQEGCGRARVGKDMDARTTELSKAWDHAVGKNTLHAVRPYEPPHVGEVIKTDDAGHRWLGATDKKGE
jgi:hypothetical protein